MYVCMFSLTYIIYISIEIIIDPVQRIAEENEGLPSKEVIQRLVDLFFRFINSVFPFVHKHTLKKQIEDGTVSKPLLWSVLAIGAR